MSPARHECRAPSLGSGSHSRQKRTESTYRRASHARLRSAHSVSHALDGFLLRKPRGLISSHCHVQDSHLRGFPRCLVGSPHRRVVPSCRLPSFSSRRVAPPLPVPLASPPGLQSEQRSVAANRRFRPANHSIPSRVFNSCGLFSGCLGDAFTPPPLMTFRVECSLYSQRRACSVSISNRPDDLSPDHLPVRALRPSFHTARRRRFRLGPTY